MATTRTYFTVATALLLLLAAAVAVSFMHLGRFQIVASLAIAGIKATLVVLFFMHVRWSSPVMRLFAAAGLVWLAILIGLTLTDVASRSNWPQQRFAPVASLAAAHGTR
jgi:cytochrome c oxidase subunit IV